MQPESKLIISEHNYSVVVSVQCNTCSNTYTHLIPKLEETRMRVWCLHCFPDLYAEAYKQAVKDGVVMPCSRDLAGRIVDPTAYESPN